MRWQKISLVITHTHPRNQSFERPFRCFKIYKKRSPGFRPLLPAPPSLIRHPKIGLRIYKTFQLKLFCEMILENYSWSKQSFVTLKSSATGSGAYDFNEQFNFPERWGGAQAAEAGGWCCGEAYQTGRRWAGGEASNFLDVDWEAEYTNGKIWLLPFNMTPLFCSLIVTQSFNTFSSHDGHQMLAKSAPQKARNRDKDKFLTKVLKSNNNCVV